MNLNCTASPNGYVNCYVNFGGGGDVDAQSKLRSSIDYCMTRANLKFTIIQFEHAVHLGLVDWL